MIVACINHLSLLFSLLAVLSAGLTMVCFARYRRNAHTMAASRYDLVRGICEWLEDETRRDPSAFSDETREMIGLLDSMLDRSQD